MRARSVKLLAVVVTLAALIGAGPAAAARQPAGAAPSQPAAPPPQKPGVNTILSSPGDGFVRVSGSNNLIAAGKQMVVDDLALNGTRQMGLFAINQINAYGQGTGKDDHPTGMVYDAFDKVWTIAQEDGSAMPANTAWSVFVPAQDLLLDSTQSFPTNTVGSRVYIDSTYFNDNAAAKVFVEEAPGAPALPPLAGPTGFAVYTHTLMVAYDALQGRWAIMSTDGAPITHGTSFVALEANANSLTSFIHVTSSANHAAPDATALDNPDLNNNPEAVLYVTQNHGTVITGTGFNHRVGVAYDQASGRWRIVTEDGAAFPNGVSYNVVVIPRRSNFFVHTATAANTTGFASRIDNPDLNDNPNARVFISHNWNPPESENDIFLDHPVAAGYNGIGWSIYNEDAGTIVSGTTFNVYYTLPRGNAFDVSASVWNSNDTATAMTVTHPLLEQRPGAIAIANFNYWPNNALHYRNALYTPTAGLAYDNLSQRWTLAVDPANTLPISTSYNILLPPLDSSFIVTGTLANTAGSDLLIDNPLTNNYRRALVFATPRDNGGFDEHPIGVYFDIGSQKWGLFNEGGAPMQVGQAFNIFVIRRSSLFLPLVRR